MMKTKSMHKPRRGGAANPTTTALKGILLLCVLVVLISQYSFLANSDYDLRDIAAISEGGDAARDPPSRSRGPPSVTSYYWPSVENSGGILGKIHAAQNPDDCASPSTRFLVWQSMLNNKQDTRGLTAWGHAGSMHLFWSLTDARVLITDDRLWPMAQGCQHGPETRECYFEPLTKCKLSDVDGYQLISSSSGKITKATSEGVTTAVVQKTNEDQYDRSVRTVYTSSSDLWWRMVKNKYSFTGLPGTDNDHSQIDMSAAALAYYFQPKPWLIKKIDEGIRRSIPEDLDPMRTVGVPIRRSDKCHGHKLAGSALGELDCPPLQKYLDEVKSFLAFDPLIENVIVTSEDSQACDEFLEMVKKDLPQLRVVRNVDDVQQGTGSGSKLEAYVEGSANADVVASALTSMHLHLRARYFVITSKSTWTSTITVFARVYGLASQIFVTDIGRNTNTFSSYARKGFQ